MGVSGVAVVAEFIAAALLLMLGNGSAIAAAGSSAQEALSFGLGTTALMYALVHYGAGQLNCAVTLSLVMAGHCGRAQGLANLSAQLLGSLAGAAALCAVFPPAEDWTRSLGANSVRPGYSRRNALIGEFAMTFLVAFVFLEALCSSKSSASRAQACLAVGFAIFVAHSVLIPVDGCSLNPTRSLGAAAVAWARYRAWEPWRDMWIFWAGPLLGAASGALLHSVLLRRAAERDGLPEGKERSGFGGEENEGDDWDSPVMAIPGSPRGIAIAGPMVGDRPVDSSGGSEWPQSIPVSGRSARAHCHAAGGESEETVLAGLKGDSTNVDALGTGGLP